MKYRKLIFIAIALFQAISLWAQTTKVITLSPGIPYTDQLSLKNDDKDMDITLKLAFNEEKNTLTASINSSKMVYVFWDATLYKKAVHHRWLRIEKLPYVVSSYPQDRFRFTKESLHRIHKPYKKYNFKAWANVTGLQPVDTERKMVNDHLEQVYNIQGMDTCVQITLRDILLMEEGPQKGKAHDYDLIYGKDLNTEYQITLKRNPCFGQDEKLQAVLDDLVNIRQSFAIFRKKYGKGTVGSQEEMQAFEDLQETLIAKYPRHTVSSSCPNIQEAQNHYNQVLDSIQNTSVTLEVDTPAGAMEAIGGAEGRVINAKTILTNARLLDNTISRWLVSRDEAERSDLLEQCRSIINETNAMIGAGSGQTPEERNAVKIFREAVQYYKRTCK